ncbi:MAG TPA: ribonuclease HI [Puia sp.]|jgi:ribonuclease HI|nr:ribonuclease HI [Puia sp.]
MSNQLIMYTDGAARGNPGPGGYGTILMWGDHSKELSCGYRYTTNNRMELMAVIAGLEALKKEGLSVTVYSDSQYVVKAVEQGWLKNWIATDFKGGKKNRDLWLQFYDLSKKYKLRFVWVRGHADNPYNNRCDELATSAADGKDLQIDQVFESEKKK